MEAFDEAIGRGLTLFEEICRESKPLAKEFTDSQSKFLGGEPETEKLARRRHLEWFVLERVSEAATETPLRAHLEDWMQRAGARERDIVEALLESRAGVFIVTKCDDDGTLWTRDLFGIGEVPIVEKGAQDSFEPGDLVVGRVFPMGDGSFRLSPAASSFRDPGLLSALESDIDGLRRSRRGVMRIQQSELEHLFFRRGGKGVPSRRAVLETARAALRSAGLDESDAADVIDAMVEATQSGNPGALVSEILNELAFSTEADLEKVRASVVVLREGLRLAKPTKPAARTPQAADASEPGDGDDATDALGNFDQGRAGGQDLAGLFSALEEELGLPPDNDVDEEIAPDFPGVVSAVVEEYLWDAQRGGEETRGEAAQALRLFAEYATEIGVFEEIGEHQLLDFAGRWILDREGVGADTVRAVIAELEPFMRWCEVEHSHPLWTDAGESIRSVAGDLPRLERARGALAGTPPASADWWAVESTTGDGIDLVSIDGRQRLQVEAPAELCQHLEADDLVRVSGSAIVAVYPAILRRLIERLSEAD